MNKNNRDFAAEFNHSDDLHGQVFALPDLPPAPTPQVEIVTVVPDGALVPAANGWTYGDFQLTRVGVNIPTETSKAEWGALGEQLFKIGGAIQWLIGDWLAYGERVWGTTYEQVAEATGYEVTTLHNLVSVCTRVDFSLRSETLSFGHHVLVAGKKPDVQDHWLRAAEVGKWSITQMREAMRLAKGEATPLSAVDKALTTFDRLKVQFDETIAVLGSDVECKQYVVEQLRAWLKELEG